MTTIWKGQTLACIHGCCSYRPRVHYSKYSLPFCCSSVLICAEAMAAGQARGMYSAGEAAAGSARRQS